MATVNLGHVVGPQGIQGIQGETGAIGPSNILNIGTVEKGDVANATITGTSPAQTLNLVLPKGDKGDQGLKGDTGATGPANTLGIGTVVGGDTAAATITGDAPNQTLNLILPKGDKGDKGDTGAKGDTGNGVPSGGTVGQVLTKNSATNFDASWKSVPDTVQVINSLTSTDTTAALSAAQGKVLNEKDVKVTISATAPSNPKTGDIWFTP